MSVARRLVAAHELDDHVDVRRRPPGGPARRSAGWAGMPPRRARPGPGRRPPASVSGPAAGRGQAIGGRSSSARMTSRPTVPAPSTPTRSGARRGWRDWWTASGRMVAKPGGVAARPPDPPNRLGRGGPPIVPTDRGAQGRTSPSQGRLTGRSRGGRAPRGSHSRRVRHEP